MVHQIRLSEDASALARVADAARADHTHEIARDVAYRRLGMVNVVFIGPTGGDWVLVDAGLGAMAGFIEAAAEARFGMTNAPRAIILTHGHFDHVGALEYLAAKWDVPVYAHILEHPYLTGKASYPPGDSKVGGGLLASLGGVYPTRPVNVSNRLHALPEDGSVPMLPDWSWIATPGHSVGHISLFRESDRLLIAGDAVITTAQESAYAVLTQAPEMHGPPAYFTVDWTMARESARSLAALEPRTIISGHGHAVQGSETLSALKRLAADFDTIARPLQGEYLSHPARAADGSAYRNVQERNG